MPGARCSTVHLAIRKQCQVPPPENRLLRPLPYLPGLWPRDAKGRSTSKLETASARVCTGSGGGLLLLLLGGGERLAAWEVAGAHASAALLPAPPLLPRLSWRTSDGAGGCSAVTRSCAPCIAGSEDARCTAAWPPGMLLPQLSPCSAASAGGSAVVG